MDAFLLGAALPLIGFFANKVLRVRTAFGGLRRRGNSDEHLHPSDPSPTLESSAEDPSPALLSNLTNPELLASISDMAEEHPQHPLSHAITSPLSSPPDSQHSESPHAATPQPTAAPDAIDTAPTSNPLFRSMVAAVSQGSLLSPQLSAAMHSNSSTSSLDQRNQHFYAPAGEICTHARRIASHHVGHVAHLLAPAGEVCVPQSSAREQAVEQATSWAADDVQRGERGMVRGSMSTSGPGASMQPPTAASPAPDHATSATPAPSCEGHISHLPSTILREIIHLAVTPESDRANKPCPAVDTPAAAASGFSKVGSASMPARHSKANSMPACPMATAISAPITPITPAVSAPITTDAMTGNVPDATTGNPLVATAASADPSAPPPTATAASAPDAPLQGGGSVGSVKVVECRAWPCHTDGWLELEAVRDTWEREGRRQTVSQAVACARSVCRSWRDLVDDSLTSLLLADWPHHMAHMRNIPQLEEVDCRRLGTDRAPLSRVVPLLVHLSEVPRLQHLTLSKDMLVVSHRFASSAGRAEQSLMVSFPTGLGLLKTLTSLKIVRGDGTEGGAHPHPVGSRKLGIRGPLARKGDDWLSIRMRPELSALSHLTSLELHDTFSPLQHAPITIRQLTLVGRSCCGSIQPDHLTPLTRLTSITLRDLAAGAALSAFLVAVRDNCKHLKHLALQAVELGTLLLAQGTFLSAADWNALAAVTSLKTLEVWAVPGADVLAALLPPLAGALGFTLQLPPDVKMPGNLVQLDLSGNSLFSLPDLSHVTQLTRLDLSYSALQSVRAGDMPTSLTALASLSLQACGLNSVPGLTCLEGLRCLDLRNNALTNLPTGLSRCSHLTRLLLAHNALTQLPSCLMALAQLKCLELSFNAIPRLDPVILTTLTALSALDLSFNRLTQLPPSMRAMRGALQRLRLGCNRLQAWPQVLSLLTQLTHLDLAGQNTVQYEHGKGIVILSEVMQLKVDALGDYTLRAPGGSSGGGAKGGAGTSAGHAVESQGAWATSPSLLFLPHLSHVLVDQPLSADTTAVATIQLLEQQGVNVAHLCEGPHDEDTMLWLGQEDSDPMGEGGEPRVEGCAACAGYV